MTMLSGNVKGIEKLMIIKSMGEEGEESIRSNYRKI